MGPVEPFDPRDPCDPSDPCKWNSFRAAPVDASSLPGASGTRPAASPRAGTLKLKAHGELELPRRAGIAHRSARRGDLAEGVAGRGAGGQVGVPEVGMVQDVEGVHPHDQRCGFGDLRGLFKRDVGVCKAGPGQRVAAQGAKAGLEIEGAPGRWRRADRTLDKGNVAIRERRAPPCAVLAE